MRIEVTRTGGFAGIERRAAVDTSGLPDADDWHELACAALASPEDRASPPAGVADGFSYGITVDDRTVRCAEPLLTDAQRALIARVLKEGA
ncbi:protealysin inhibitor emfourin [Streptomyces sp. NPDC060194]|uniref:protealysin inhibitor emfourin n=1 Tax=Streptomyces sp. NPDC060194 TaxID=3347069 RepID=UPI00364862EF